MSLVIAPEWHVVALKRGAMCAQCRRPLAEGELIAYHVNTRLGYHPACAGVPSGGAVASPVTERVHPVTRRAA